MRRFLALTLILLTAFVLLPSAPAEAHVLKPIYHDTCRFDWRANVANRVKVARCFASYFDLKPDRMEGMFWCESGFQLDPPGYYEGPAQYDPDTWDAIKGHYWNVYADAHNMRHAAAVTSRYIRHGFLGPDNKKGTADDGDGWAPWPHCGDYDVAMYHYHLHN